MRAMQTVKHLHLHILGKRKMTCALCGRSFSLDNLLEWSLDGAPMTPARIGPSYARSLAQVRRALIRQSQIPGR